MFSIFLCNLGHQELEKFAIVCKDFNSIAADITVLDADPHEEDSAAIASVETLRDNGDSIVLNGPRDDVTVVGAAPAVATLHRSISSASTLHTPVSRPTLHT